MARPLIRLDKDTHARLQQESERTGVTMSEIFREALSSLPMLVRESLRRDNPVSLGEVLETAPLYDLCASAHDRLDEAADDMSVSLLIRTQGALSNVCDALLEAEEKAEALREEEDNGDDDEDEDNGDDEA